MPLTRIEAHNFKSFRDLDVSLGSLNVLIGANASGKSNFVQLLSFVRDIANFGLENAASIQGGSEYIANLQLGSGKATRIDLTIKEEDFFSLLNLERNNSSIHSRVEGLRYEFELQALPDQPTYKIKNDRFTVFRRFFRKGDTSGSAVTELGIGTLDFTHNHGQLHHEFTFPGDFDPVQMGSSFWDALWELGTARKQPIKGLLIQNMSEQASLLPLTPIEQLKHLMIYDFNAKLPKQTAQITGKVDLEEDGSNLVIALKNILEDEGQRREFSNLLRDVLPFAESVDVQRLADRFLHFRLRESYSGDQYLPASLLSDGTIHVIALIVALYFSDKPLIVIEEPERNIHPYLLARVAALLKDASRNKQIIVTTHNPEIVKHVALEDLLFVSRDREGFSTIRRPAESADVRVFLANEIGIDELFARNLLGA